LKKKTGFTLIEVLVSILIIGIVSTGTYVSFSVLSQTSERNRNQDQVIHLAQAALEEIRVVAQNNFDNLESVIFSDIDQSKYPGFHRNIRINSMGGSSDLKRSDVTIRWDERGRPRQYDLAFLLSRPPEPLPANIHGRATNANTGSGVNGATVRITYVTDQSLSYTTTTDSNGNYTFLDADKNQVLKTGDWNLMVTCSGYYDSETISVNNLSSGEDREVNVSLRPRPDPAYIRGGVAKKGTGSLLYQYVSLYQNGVHITNTLSGSNGFEFKINFNDTNQRCFTITTGNSDYYYPYRYNQHCGDFCDPHGWGKSYNYRGWSSAVVGADGSLNCSNPWFGSSTTDRICVNPGDNLNIGNIPLVPVPTGRLNGYVYQSDGVTPVSGAWIDTLWHSGYWASGVGTGANGYYETNVPAAQELFPNNSNYYLWVRACGEVPIMGCCNTPSTQGACTSFVRVGFIFQADTLTQDFILPSRQNRRCGNARGYVRNGETGAGLNNVSVSIAWRSRSTDGTGLYEFKCSPPNEDYCSIPEGYYSVSASSSGYYNFHSSGNNWYSQRGAISIQENQTTTYGDIRLWPQGYGTIKGRVVIAGTGTPISGATVSLNLYTGSGNSVTTDGQGRFQFNNIPETWPPPAVVGDNYYNQTEKKHSLDLSYTNTYEPQTISDLILNDGETLDLGDIGLVLKGHM